MAVLESQAHPVTQRAGDAPYGCRDRVISPGYFAPARVFAADGSFAVASKFIPHVMSTECRYDNSLTDPRCAVCKHKGSGERYDAMIRERGQA